MAIFYCLEFWLWTCDQSKIQCFQRFTKTNQSHLQVSLKHYNATMQDQTTHKKASTFCQVCSLQMTLFLTSQNLFLSFHQCKPYFTFELQWTMLRMIFPTLMNWIWCMVYTLYKIRVIPPIAIWFSHKISP